MNYSNPVIMKKLFFLLFIGIFSGHLVSAQGWELVFPKEPVETAANQIIHTLDGNYLSVGRGLHPLIGLGDVYRKFDDQGQVIWEEEFDGLGDSHINNLSDNTYIAFLNLASSEFNKVRKLGQDGELIWETPTYFPLDDRRIVLSNSCLLYISPSPRDRQKSRMPSSA